VENFGILYDHLVCILRVICFSLRQFGIVAICDIFPILGKIYQEKSGNPGLALDQCLSNRTKKNFQILGHRASDSRKTADRPPASDLSRRRFYETFGPATPIVINWRKMRFGLK
jgi:hypothetical protein